METKLSKLVSCCVNVNFLQIDLFKVPSSLLVSNALKKDSFHQFLLPKCEPEVGRMTVIEYFQDAATKSQFSVHIMNVSFIKNQAP